MKKTLRILLIIAACLLLVTLPAAASGSYYDASLPRVIDNANLFSLDAEAKLQEGIDELLDKYETDVVIMTVTALSDPSLPGRFYLSIQDFTDDFYDYNGYGCGTDKTGIILVISMAPGNHEYQFVTTGGEYQRFGSKDVEYMKGQLESLLGDGDFYGAAKRFLEMVDYEHVHGRQPIQPGDLLFTFSIAVVVSLCIVGNMKRKMNPVRRAEAAANYIVPGSYKLRDYNEIFLNRTVTRAAKPKSSSGGGGSHVGSSGTSHGGGGGHF